MIPSERFGFFCPTVRIAALVGLAASLGRFRCQPRGGRRPAQRGATHHRSLGAVGLAVSSKHAAWEKKSGGNRRVLVVCVSICVYFFLFLGKRIGNLKISKTHQDLKNVWVAADSLCVRLVPQPRNHRRQYECWQPPTTTIDPTTEEEFRS